jgi:plasmid stability protein
MNIAIRNLPDAVHAVLLAEAKRRCVSLSDVIREVLIERARMLAETTPAPPSPR